LLTVPIYKVWSILIQKDLPSHPGLDLECLSQPETAAGLKTLQKVSHVLKIVQEASDAGIELHKRQPTGIAASPYIQTRCHIIASNIR
jgi:hypothetical protein